MPYLFQLRFNLFDTTAITVAAVMLTQDRWIVALLVAVFGTIGSVLLSGYFKLRDLHRQWQVLVDDGLYSSAIKKHQELFNSSFRDAAEEVRAYEQGRPYRQ